jgi:hypothetical protein
MNVRRDGFINIKDMSITMSVRGEHGFVKLMKKNKAWRSLECIFTS